MQSMQLTDWLVVIFIGAIVGVLIDGVRRKLAERRKRVVMKLEKNIPQDVDPDEFPSSELPNGGARAIPREGQPVPSLRTLQAKRKLAFRSARIAEDPGTRAVPVLLDAVDVEEERIEHTNVFADPHAAVSFQADDFGPDDGLESEVSPVRVRNAEPAFPARAPEDDADELDELIDGLDEEYEEDAMLAEPEVARKEPGYMETRYQGRRDDDDDEDEFEEEEELEDDEEEDDDLEEFDDDLDDDDDEDEDDDEEDDDDLDDDDDEDELDDEEDDDDDLDDDEDEEDDDEDDEDLDELEGLPEDEWGAEEEQDVLVDDYENEPMPLQGAFDKAASQLDKVANQAATQFDKAASQLDKVASQAATQFDKVASHAANRLDKAATQAANHFTRPPRGDAPRIEPGFGDDGLDAGSFDDTAFTEDFTGAWNDDADVAETGDFDAPRPAPAAKAAPGKRDQGELFVAPKDSPREGREGREESRLMAALQKAVPRGQPAPQQTSATAANVPQEVIIINVMARAGQTLHGGDLLGVLQAQGLRLGDMSIFHRHADSHGSGPVMFSMANMVKPGTFDLATMDEFSTPGVSFFLQLPNKLGNMACFDRMLGAATAVRDAFDAELKDEHRSVFTRQTVEHCRQRVRDFELKLLSRK
jgi:cell division protein ZipA